MNYLLITLLLGIGATLITDLWGLLRKYLLGIPAPNYALVGRWFSHMIYGRFHHASIKSASSIHGEAVIGWAAHYLIGIVFAALLIGIWGEAWIQHPTIGPALAVGLGTVLAPFLLMQPGMGSGIAASRTPNPGAARLQSFIMHGVFGLGLYATGRVLSFFY
tara:strand:+ start:521 stop:1006 length:486 start_codon:yes stop_codon:yes gene_type:complete